MQPHVPKPSIFDDATVPADYQLWRKGPPAKNASETRLYESILFKKSATSEFWKSRYFVLFEDRLACFKNAREKTESSHCPITNVRVEALLHEGDREEKFGVRLTHNKHVSELFARSKDIQDKWMEALTKLCVLTNYSTSFVNLKAIGKGSFARVFLAKRKSDNAELAVKTFDKNLLSSADKAKPSLVNEITIMRKLEHDSIIKLYQVYESENHIYLVLELLNGGELFERIVKKGQYSEKDACVLMKNLLSALEYLHAKGIMHRDLKPENLILKDNENDWDVKIADFGLAQVIKSEEFLFKRCGTPGYVAPEILADEKYDEKVDIFSAGVILFILLAGGSPFHGKSYNEILWKNKNCEIDFNFKKYGQRVSEPAIDLMKKMLTKDPKERISATEALKHQWIATGGVFMSPRTQAPVLLSSAQENMKRFQEENRFNVKSIKPKGLDGEQAALDKPAHAPSPLINGRVTTVADSKNQSFMSPDVRKTSQMAGRLMGMVSPMDTSSGSKGPNNTALSAEMKFMDVNLGGYNPSNPNQNLMSRLTENTAAKRPIQQMQMPLFAKRAVPTNNATAAVPQAKPSVKKALNVQDTLMKYLGVSSQKPAPTANKENTPQLSDVQMG